MRIPEDQDPKRTVALPRLQGAVAFEHVDFAYEADKPVLHDVSFVAGPGSVVALVGSSGSGKSTIIGLLAAFHTPQAGRVTVDSVDLSTVRLDSFRTQLGVVLQDTFLFAGTIRENVAFSRHMLKVGSNGRDWRAARLLSGRRWRIWAVT